MRGLARDGKTPPDGFMAPRYNVYTHIASQCTWVALHVSMCLWLQGVAGSV